MKRKFMMTGIAALVFAVVALFAYAGGAIKTVFSSRSAGQGTAFAQEHEMAKAIFTVKCYDEGKAALQGLHGVRKVETGIHYLKETDTVSYDPKIITIQEMEAVLKKAGTYVKTVREK
jgi:copper chaperone CopZ